MIYIIMFILLITIRDIYVIIDNKEKNKVKMIIIYVIIAILAITAGIYYEKSEYGKSLTYYIIKLIGKSY